jgi:transmembrane sensor
MSTNDERVRGLITQEAADWFVANRAGLTPEQRPAFAAWLKASPVHVEEYLTLSVIARDLRQACEDSPSSVEALLARARLEEHTPVQLLWPRVIASVRNVAARRWQTVAVTMAAIGALTLGLLAWRDLRPIAQISSTNDATALYFETRHGEQQTHRLADNSVLHLNTDSAVIIRYLKEERLVVLTSGEADFEVAHEADRKFRVFAGAAEIVAIGTKFDVRLEQDSTKVTVVEGRVAVGPSPVAVGPSTKANPDQMLRSMQLDADEQMSVVEGEWPAAPIAVDAQRATAWLQRRIIFEHEPLERVASEINRYAPKPIEITTPALRKLEISGVFATDDIEAFIAFLRSLKDVRVEVTETRIRVSQD